jgi:multiple sugar transport system substrate-binding protein
MVSPTKKITRRTFLRTSAFAGTAGVLAACVVPAAAPAGDGGAAPAMEDVTLRMVTHYGSPVRREFTTRVKDIFEATHPGVTVEVEVAPDIDVRWQTEVAAKTLPVMLWDANLFCEMAAQGVFLPLDDRLPMQQPPVNMDDYNVPTGAECMVWNEGQQIAMPWINGAPLIYYNVDMFEEVGIGRPSDDWTWDDFLDVAKELTRDTDGDGEIDQWGYMQSTRWDEHFAQWIFANGGEIVTEDRSHTPLDTPEASGAIEFLYDLRFTHNVWPQAEQMEAMQALGIGSLFNGGKVAMTYGGTGGIGSFNRDIADFTYDILHFPKSPATGNRALWTFMQNFAGPIWSEHPDLDADLAIALGGPSSQQWAGRTKIQVPIYTPAVEGEYATKPPENIRVVPEMFAEPGVQHLPIFNGKTEWLQTVFGGELTKAFIGEANLADAIQSAVAEGDRILGRQ